MPYPNPNVPITRWTDVQIGFRVSDSGSGLRNVTLRYSNSSDLDASPSWTAEMHLLQGDNYDGNWTVLLRPEIKGIAIFYQPEGYDFCGNKRYGEKRGYDVQNLTSPRADIQITVDDLDFASKLMTIGIVCTISYASPYDAFLLQIEQGFGSGYCWNVNATHFSIPRVGGFFYQGTLKWRTRMAGAINFYPFDSYIIDLHMKLLLSPLDKNSARIVFVFYGPLSLLFDYNVPRNQTESLQDGVNMFFVASVTRKPSLISPIMQPIYATFFVLGSIALLSFRRDDLSNRLRILIGLFTFVVILFFTITRILQDAGLSEKRTRCTCCHEIEPCDQDPNPENSQLASSSPVVEERFWVSWSMLLNLQYISISPLVKGIRATCHVSRRDVTITIEEVTGPH
jgi:hypothetical protein